MGEQGYRHDGPTGDWIGDEARRNRYEPPKASAPAEGIKVQKKSEPIETGPACLTSSD